MKLDEVYTQKIFAGAVSAIPDFLLKHAPDTLSKRQQVNGEKPFWDAISPGGKFKGYRPLIRSMADGAAPGFGYKMLQRTLTYPLSDFYKHQLSTQFSPESASKYQTPIAFASGILVGWSEPVFLLWADHLKVAAQTNPKAQQSILQYAINNKGALYNGFWVTASRNTVGSSLFFGGTAYVKNQLEESSFFADKPTAQIATATFSGTFLRVAGPYLIDSIKTIIQSGKGESGRAILAQMRQQYGTWGTIKRLYAGLPIKLASQGLPVFSSWFVYNYLTNKTPPKPPVQAQALCAHPQPKLSILHDTKLKTRISEKIIYQGYNH